MKFLKKAKKFIIDHWKEVSILTIPLLFAFSYIWFALIKGFVPAGDSLQKSDWLSFWGSFLSFSGSLILGVVAVWQNNRANELNEKSILENKRISELQNELNEKAISENKRISDLQSEWNKKAILENRRMSEIQFEHELKRNEYMLIINGVQSINNRIYNIVQSTQKITTDKSLFASEISKAYLESIISDIRQLQYAEMDTILPVFYEEKYLELKMGKKEINEALIKCVTELQNAIESLENNKKPSILLNYPNDTLAQLSSCFYKKLNNIQSYRSFTKEEMPNGNQTET